jgi:hypothetical protein
MKRKNKEMKLKGFSIQFLPYSEIKDLESDKRIKKVLDIVSKNNILLLQGRLKPEEETKLIGDTMGLISKGKGFLGVELAVISDTGNETFFSKIKRNIANALSGGDLGTITIVGPATVVKEIKKNPKKIELLLNK